MKHCDDFNIGVSKHQRIYTLKKLITKCGRFKCMYPNYHNRKNRTNKSAS